MTSTKIPTWSPLFFMTKHKRIICNYVNIIYFAFSNSLENPESYFKKSQFCTVYWWQSSCTTQLTLSYIGKKKQKREKEKKRLAGTKKVYWCIHQIQKTNRKLASRKISNNSQWGDNFSEEEVAFLRLIHIPYARHYNPRFVYFKPTFCR